MKKFFTFRNDYKNGVIQVKPNLPSGDIFPQLLFSTKEKLPDEIVFSIKKGKKWTDLIYYYEFAVIFFVSERVINLFSSKMDMSNSYYPIKFKESDTPQYYKLYNVKQYEGINGRREEYNYEEVPYFYLPEGEIPPALFTLKGSNMHIIDEDTMNQMKQMKITNIYFDEVYGLNDKEYEELKILHAQHKILIPRP